MNVKQFLKNLSVRNKMALIEQYFAESSDIVFYDEKNRGYVIENFMGNQTLYSSDKIDKEIIKEFENIVESKTLLKKIDFTEFKDTDFENYNNIKNLEAFLDYNVIINKINNLTGILNRVNEINFLRKEAKELNNEIKIMENFVNKHLDENNSFDSLAFIDIANILIADKKEIKGDFKNYLKDKMTDLIEQNEKLYITISSVILRDNFLKEIGEGIVLNKENTNKLEKILENLKNNDVILGANIYVAVPSDDGFERAIFQERFSLKEPEIYQTNEESKKITLQQIKSLSKKI